MSSFPRDCPAPPDSPLTEHDHLRVYAIQVAEGHSEVAIGASIAGNSLLSEQCGRASGDEDRRRTNKEQFPWAAHH